MNRTTVAELIESEATGGSAEFGADEAALAGAFVENAIGDDDLDADDMGSLQETDFSQGQRRSL